MNHSNQFLTLLIFFVILFISCQKDNIQELETRILFSVDLDNQKFDPDLREAYLAAYTSNGALINYGSLTDSSKWDLMGECIGDKIDILYFEIINKSSLTIDHIRNVSIGQTFRDNNSVTIHPPTDMKITLKVEDFGNYSGNSTSNKVFEMFPRKFNRGAAYSGEFSWDKIIDGYSYKTTYIDFDSEYLGAELLIFERGTNAPYVYYLDIDETGFNSEDTVTLIKSDFSPGESKTIQVNSLDNEFDNMFLYTYNSVEGKKDLITSFDQVIPGTSSEKYINYIISDILPINYWEFKYFNLNPGYTSYLFRTNKDIPASIEVLELDGFTITKSGNEFNINHGNTFPDKNLTRSVIQFCKAEGNNFLYSMHFDGTESSGTTSISLFEIPDEIVGKYSALFEANSKEWKAYQYAQTYTEIPDNSPLDYLKNSKLSWVENNFSTDDFIYEVFTANLQE